MRIPTKFVALAGAALALLGASANSQAQRNKLFRRASSPRQATLDLRTGTYTRGPVVNDRGVVTVTDLSNVDALDGSGFGWVTTDTGGGACTWFDNASKGLGMNQGGQNCPGSDLMSSVTFFYCSGALDLGSGGPGGAVELGFYEGYTIFGGAPTTTATVVLLTGLPGNSAPGGFLAGSRCYGLSVLFTPLVAFADNIFVGYSWHYLDVGTDGLYAATFPFLSCVVSCSGTSILNGSAGGIGTATGLGEDGQGMLDAFDVFCTGAFPNGPTQNTYTFTTAGPFAPPFAPTTRASVSMEIRETCALATTDVDYNDVAPIQNPDTLTATPATLGLPWVATFTRAGGGAGLFRIGVWMLRHPLANGGPASSGTPAWPAGTGGRLLTAGGFLSYVPPVGFAAYAAGTGMVASVIPCDITFCNLHFAAQARSGTGPLGLGVPRLSSAVEGTIGTF